MIESFRHKGLRKLFEEDDRRKVPAVHIEKLRRILARLNEATVVQHMGLPGYRLHRLKGDLEGFWSVWVSENWRVIFRFEDGQACDVDLIDYH
jgi:proteic killer suppression protein